MGLLAVRLVGWLSIKWRRRETRGKRTQERVNSMDSGLVALCSMAFRWMLAVVEWPSCVVFRQQVNLLNCITASDWISCVSVPSFNCELRFCSHK